VSNYLRLMGQGWKISGRLLHHLGNAAAGINPAEPHLASGSLAQENLLRENLLNENPLRDSLARKNLVRKNLARKNLLTANLVGWPQPLSDHLPNPIDRGSQPQKPRTSVDQLKTAHMIAHMVDRMIAHMTVKLAGPSGKRPIMTALHRRMINHGGQSTPVNAQSDLLARLRQRQPKACLAKARNLPAGLALVMPPQRNDRPKTNGPAPRVNLKNLVKSKPRAILPASQQSRTAAMGTVRRLVMLEMPVNGRKNRAKNAAVPLVLGHLVLGYPDQGHHDRSKVGMAA
jgi:hypothetical protein